MKISQNIVDTNMFTRISELNRKGFHTPNDQIDNGMLRVPMKI